MKYLLLCLLFLQIFSAVAMNNDEFDYQRALALPNDLKQLSLEAYHACSGYKYSKVLECYTTNEIIKDEETRKIVMDAETNRYVARNRWFLFRKIETFLKSKGVTWVCMVQYNCTKHRKSLHSPFTGSEIVEDLRCLWRSPLPLDLEAFSVVFLFNKPTPEEFNKIILASWACQWLENKNKLLPEGRQILVAFGTKKRPGIIKNRGELIWRTTTQKYGNLFKRVHEQVDSLSAQEENYPTVFGCQIL